MANKISLSGLKGCGKSEVAKAIMEEGDFTLLSFAKPLKDFLSLVLLWDNKPEEVKEALYGEDKDNALVNISLRPVTLLYPMYKVLGQVYEDDAVDKFVTWATKFNEGEFVGKKVSGRRLLQTVGTEFFQGTYGPSFWVSRMREILDKIEGNVVVDDTRFNHEALLLRIQGFKMVNIISPRWKDAAFLEHPSEKGPDINFDIHFLNDKELGKDPIYKFIRGELL